MFSPIELYIGVEAIGMSFSVAVLSDNKGSIKAAVRGKAFSLHTSQRCHLRMSLMKLLHDLEQSYCRRIEWSKVTLCIGLTGVTFPYDANVDLPEELRRIDILLSNDRFICTGDAEIITAAYTQATQAAALIAHTGSTAYYYNSGQTRRFGGWGPQLGDEGSAFSIGRNAVRRILLEYDSQLPISDLWQQMSDWLDHPRPHTPSWIKASDNWRICTTCCRETKQDKRTALFHLAHSLTLHDPEEWRCLAAGLAIPVIRAWQNGDATATAIISEAAQSLADQYAGLFNNPPSPSPAVPLVLYGGLFRFHSEFRDLVIARLRANPQVQPQRILLPNHVSAMRPACGALLFALGHSIAGTLLFPSPQIVKTVHKTLATPTLIPFLAND
jgi:N-acetylglucosamine kinase-like BadF-type ATPase